MGARVPRRSRRSGGCGPGARRAARSPRVRSPLAASADLASGCRRARSRSEPPVVSSDGGARDAVGSRQPHTRFTLRVRHDARISRRHRDIRRRSGHRLPRSRPSEHPARRARRRAPGRCPVHARAWLRADGDLQLSRGHRQRRGVGRQHRRSRRGRAGDARVGRHPRRLGHRPARYARDRDLPDPHAAPAQVRSSAIAIPWPPPRSSNARARPTKRFPRTTSRTMGTAGSSTVPPLPPSPAPASPSSRMRGPRPDSRRPRRRRRHPMRSTTIASTSRPVPPPRRTRPHRDGRTGRGRCASRPGDRMPRSRHRRAGARAVHRPRRDARTARDAATARGVRTPRARGRGVAALAGHRDAVHHAPACCRRGAALSLRRYRSSMRRICLQPFVTTLACHHEPPAEPASTNTGDWHLPPLPDAAPPTVTRIAPVGIDPFADPESWRGVTYGSLDRLAHGIDCPPPMSCNPPAPEHVRRRDDGRAGPHRPGRSRLAHPHPDRGREDGADLARALRRRARRCPPARPLQDRRGRHRRSRLHLAPRAARAHRRRHRRAARSSSSSARARHPIPIPTGPCSAPHAPAS